MILGMVILFIFGISFTIFMVANSHQFDHLIYIRYTMYGNEHFYRSRWSYRLVISSFGLILAFLHNIIAVKLYNVAGRKFAFIFLGFSFILAAIAFFVMNTALMEIPN